MKRFASSPEKSTGPKACLFPGGASADGTRARDIGFLKTTGQRHSLSKGPIP